MADTGNHRVLIWRTFPKLTGGQADVVLGHGKGEVAFNGNAPNNGKTPYGDVFNSPTGVFYSKERNMLIVVDSENNRLLGFNKPLTTIETGDTATHIYGQLNFQQTKANFEESDGSVSDIGFSMPNQAIIVHDGKNWILAVSDTGNNRVMLFYSLENAPRASRIIEEVTLKAGDDGIRSKLSQPVGLAQFGSHFAISDTGNKRVLVFDGIPENGAMATVLSNIGDECDPGEFTEPRGLFMDEFALFAADGDPHRSRILLFH